MKYLVLTVLAAASLGANAQLPTNPPAPSVPAATVAPDSGALASRSAVAGARVAPGAAAPGQALVNPFNGKPLSAEQLQRELEASRAETVLLEERLKQATLNEELRNIPLRKSVEAEQSRTALRKEAASQKELDAILRPPPPPAPAKATSGKKAAKASQKKSAEPDVESDDVADKPVVKTEPKPEIRMEPPKPVLSSVIEVGDRRSAVLQIGADTVTVADGDMTPMGPLKVLDKQSVNLGGQILKVHGSTMARFVMSDPIPVKPGSSGGPAYGNAPVSGANNVSQALGTPASNASPSPTGAQGLPPMPAQRNALPPLTLPPGVTLMPSTVGSK